MNTFAAHPKMRLEPPKPLAEGSSGDAFTQQLAQLTAVVDEAIKQTPGSPFNLGRVEVTVSASGPPPEPVVASIDQTDIRDLNLVNAAKALDYLPGVSIQHLSANRNEAGIMVRGFSTRGQVPLYLDGIPISVPYDGYVDFNRFLTSDLSEIQVAKGYSSPLLGPNALGGSINMVTQEPVKKSMSTPSSAPAPVTLCYRPCTSALAGAISFFRVESIGVSSTTSRFRAPS